MANTMSSANVASAVQKALTVILLGALGLGMPGCMGLSFGGGSSIQQAIQPPTIGRELEDLAAARKRGAITDDEYAQAKQKLVQEGRKF